MQLAFHLSDKYRNPAVVLSDGVVGLVSETLELKTLDFEPLPEKEWAVRGKDNHDDGVRRFIDSYVAYGKIREGLWSLMITMIMETDGVGAKYSGAALGLSSTITPLGNFLAPPIGNRLALIKPGYAFLFWAALGVVGLVIFHFIRETGWKRKAAA